MATAKDLGASALATGHYVRRVAGPAGPELHRARDGARDQSYFLFATTRAELEFLRFPLGGLAKDETRALARRFGLMVADKPDSQDICFVPQGSYAGLVEMLRPKPPSRATSSTAPAGCSAIIAASPISPWVSARGWGSPRRSRSLCWRSRPRSAGSWSGPREALAETRVRLTELNWLARDPPAAAGMALAARLRSAQPPVAATLYPGAAPGAAELVFAEPTQAVAPGQAAVLYDGERVLGGGWIRRPAPTPAG